MKKGQEIVEEKHRTFGDYRGEFCTNFVQLEIPPYDLQEMEEIIDEDFQEEQQCIQMPIQIQQPIRYQLPVDQIMNEGEENPEKKSKHLCCIF